MERPGVRTDHISPPPLSASTVRYLLPMSTHTAKHAFLMTSPVRSEELPPLVRERVMFLFFLSLDRLPASHPISKLLLRADRYDAIHLPDNQQKKKPPSDVRRVPRTTNNLNRPGKSTDRHDHLKHEEEKKARRRIQRAFTCLATKPGLPRGLDVERRSIILQYLLERETLCGP